MEEEDAFDTLMESESETRSSRYWSNWERSLNWEKFFLFPWREGLADCWNW